jgi:hypothetical protein
VTIRHARIVRIPIIRNWCPYRSEDLGLPMMDWTDNRRIASDIKSLAAPSKAFPLYVSSKDASWLGGCDGGVVLCRRSRVAGLESVPLRRYRVLHVIAGSSRSRESACD